jgi:hypothetical protein
VCFLRICDYKFAIYGYFAEHNGNRLRSKSNVYLPNLWAMSLNYEIRSWSDRKSRCVYPRFDRVQSGIVGG